jgi:hypothetical protein
MSIKSKINRARKAGALLSIPRGMIGEQDPFPKRVHRILPYIDIGITTASGATSTTSGATPLQYVLNSLFAPGGSNAHQPYGFDTLATLYRRYRVNAVEVEIEFTTVQQLAAKADPTDAIMMFTPPGSSVSTVFVALAASIFAEKPGGEVRRCVPGHPSALQTVRRMLPMHQLVGVSKSEYEANVEEYAALVSGDPTRTTSLFLNCAGFGTISASIYWRVKLSFHAEFWERLILAQS